MGQGTLVSGAWGMFLAALFGGLYVGLALRYRIRQDNGINEGLRRVHRDAEIRRIEAQLPDSTQEFINRLDAELSAEQEKLPHNHPFRRMFTIREGNRR